MWITARVEGMTLKNGVNFNLNFLLSKKPIDEKPDFATPTIPQKALIPLFHFYGFQPSKELPLTPTLNSSTSYLFLASQDRKRFRNLIRLN